VSEYSVLSQQVTIRDALFTAFTLDIFNRHAEKISIAACAQLINCINALFLAHEDKFVTTPNFHVFDMYAAHQGGEALRTEFSSPEAKYTRDSKPAAFWGLNGSASLKGKSLTLTVVNADASLSRETEIAIRGASVVSATAEILSAPDMHAHNSLDRSEVGEPATASVSHVGSFVHFVFPPASVTALTLRLS
jgi:alpha-N-arabinofuranosidase